MYLTSGLRLTLFSRLTTSVLSAVKGPLTRSSDLDICLLRRTALPFLEEVLEEALEAAGESPDGVLEGDLEAVLEAVLEGDLEEALEEFEELDSLREAKAGAGILNRLRKLNCGSISSPWKDGLLFSLKSRARHRVQRQSDSHMLRGLM